MKSWIVRAKCTGMKEFLVSASTVEEAREQFDRLDNVQSESALELTDWDLVSIEENA